MKKGHAKTKWDFAIGTTSRVPNSHDLHYLIMDIDFKIAMGHVVLTMEKLGASAVIVQATKHGHHVYTDVRCSWKQLFHLMPSYVDQTWLSIGKKRGYLFLADKTAINFPWPVERMILHAKEK